METQNIIKVLKESAHVGMILPADARLDILAGAEAIGRALIHQGKIAGFLPPLPDPSRMHPGDAIFPFLVSAQALPKEFIVSVDTIQSPVSQLRYTKEEGKIEITLSPKSLPIREDSLSFRAGKIQCDAVVAIGIPDIEPYKTASGLEPEFFSQNPVINIDVAPENTGYGTARMGGNPHAAISEIVSLLIKDWQPQELTPDVSTLLLAGILERTNAFSFPTPRAEILIEAAFLLQNGADYESALALERRNRDISLLQLFGRASVRSKVSRDRRIVWSFLTREDFEKTNRSSRDIPEVAAHLAREFGLGDATALVWHDPETKKIRADIRGKADAISRIGARAPGEDALSAKAQAGLSAEAQAGASGFRLARSFETFQEAEEYLSPLLEDAL